MRKTLRKMTAIILAVMTVLTSAAVFSVSAEYGTPHRGWDGTTALSGKYLDYTWKVSGKTLTISGKGEMDNYYGGHPWSDNIEKVVIGNGITSIGYGAFYNCKKLRSVILPNTLKYIDGFAFGECDSLTSFTLPEGIEDFYGNIFDGCDNLKSITFPSTIRTIPEMNVTGGLDSRGFHVKSITIKGFTTRFAPWVTPTFCDVVYGHNYSVAKKDAKELGTKFRSIDTSTAKNLGTTQITSLQNTSDGIKVKWNAIKGVKRYALYVCAYGDTEWTGFDVTGTSFTYKPDSSLSGKMHYFQVLPVSDSGAIGGYSKVKSLVYLSKPKITHVTYDGANTTVVWDWCKKATKYEIARKQNGESSYKYFYASKNADRWVDTTVQAGKQYSYQVRGIYEAKGTKTYSAWSKTFTSAALKKTEPKLSVKSNGIRVEWEPVDGAAKYIVYYKKYWDSSWSSKVTINTYFPMLDVDHGEKYSFQVRPVTLDGFGGTFSSVKSSYYYQKPVIAGAYFDDDTDLLSLYYEHDFFMANIEFAYRKLGETEYNYVTDIEYGDRIPVERGCTYQIQIRPVSRDGNAPTVGLWSKTFTYTVE